MVQRKGKIRVLIVEDDALQATLMVQILSQSGCEVWAVHTGKKGMELALENQFDLIALDIRLPDINGFEVCKELKQRHVSRHTPIIFVSGQFGEEDKRHGLELGAADYIEKPFGGLTFARRILSHVTSKPIYA